jgi:hypothetical protein
MLTCKTCRETKPDDSFYKHRNRIKQPCKACHIKAAKARYRNRRDYWLVLMRRQRLNVYGLSLEDWDHMLEVQGARCAICGTDDPGNGNKAFAVDHDARTGAVRGLLCVKCNRGLGHFADDPARLRSAADYLEANHDFRSARPLFS